MATVNLGSIKFNWQGAYNGATAYSVDDVVSYNGASYICTAASTGNLPTDTNFWDQMSSAGTDGTDLTSTLTTQGDIVYRDASGLARLGAGTSGQVLQTNGTGANPSWVDASGGIYENLLNGSVSSAVSQVSFDNVFSSTYEHYRLFMNDLSFASNTIIYMRFRQGGSNFAGSNYIWTASHPSQTSGGSSHNTHGGWANGHFGFIGDNSLLSDNDYGAQGIIDIYQPSASRRTFYTWHAVSWESGQLNVHYGGGMHATNDSFDGIAVLAQNGSNVDSLNYALFGVKHS